MAHPHDRPPWAYQPPPDQRGTAPLPAAGSGAPPPQRHPGHTPFPSGTMYRDPAYPPTQYADHRHGPLPPARGFPDPQLFDPRYGQATQRETDFYDRRVLPTQDPRPSLPSYDHLGYREFDNAHAPPYRSGYDAYHPRPGGYEDNIPPRPSMSAQAPPAPPSPYYPGAYGQRPYPAEQGHGYGQIGLASTEFDQPIQPLPIQNARDPTNQPATRGTRQGNNSRGGAARGSTRGRGSRGRGSRGGAARGSERQHPSARDTKNPRLKRETSDTNRDRRHSKSRSRSPISRYSESRDRRDSRKDQRSRSPHKKSPYPDRDGQRRHSRNRRKKGPRDDSASSDDVPRTKSKAKSGSEGQNLFDKIVEEAVQQRLSKHQVQSALETRPDVSTESQPKAEALIGSQNTVPAQFAAGGLAPESGTPTTKVTYEGRPTISTQSVPTLGLVKSDHYSQEERPTPGSGTDQSQIILMLDQVKKEQDAKLGLLQKNQDAKIGLLASQAKADQLMQQARHHILFQELKFLSSKHDKTSEEMARHRQILEEQPWLSNPSGQPLESNQQGWNPYQTGFSTLMDVEGFNPSAAQIPAHFQQPETPQFIPQQDQQIRPPPQPMTGPPEHLQPGSAEADALSREKSECLDFLGNLFGNIKKQRKGIETAQQEDLTSLAMKASQFMGDFPEVITDPGIQPHIQNLQRQSQKMVDDVVKHWSEFWQALDNMARTGPPKILQAQDSPRIQLEQKALDSEFQTYRSVRDLAISRSIRDYQAAAYNCQSACIARENELRRVSTRGLHWTPGWHDSEVFDYEKMPLVKLTGWTATDGFLTRGQEFIWPEDIDKIE